MALVDELKINVCSGKGGDGVVKWLRSRRDQKGGPVGGNGGKGASVFLTGVQDIERLSKYKSNPKFRAENGINGGGNSLEGKDGEDLHISIPTGSLVTNLNTGETYDIITRGESIQVLAGGKGGYGNEHFKGSRNVTPMEQTDGKLGTCTDFKVELRLIADAGFIGYPNAGKSTLLNTLTSSNAKVGNYSFTTLNPNLGVLDNFVLADIPGLIEGASQGKGLGDRFLRHIMRTKRLIHCISAERDDIKEAYNVIQNELREYNPELLNKEEMIVITKSDEVTDAELQERLKDAQKIDKNAITVSILDDKSIKQLRERLLKVL